MILASTATKTFPRLCFCAVGYLIIEAINHAWDMRSQIMKHHFLFVSMYVKESQTHRMQIHESGITKTDAIVTGLTPPV
jgi:hypothetical protein